MKRTLLVAIVALLPFIGQAAETNSLAITDEQRLLDAIPQLEWSQRKLISDGWVKPGQVVNEKRNFFSKKGCTCLGLNGEAAFNYEAGVLWAFGFYLDDGEVGTTKGDEEFARLYKALKDICPKTEKRTGDGKKSSIEWVVVGEKKTYTIELSRSIFKKSIERGFDITIVNHALRRMRGERQRNPDR